MCIRDSYYIDNLEIARLTPDSIDFFNIDKEPITRESKMCIRDSRCTA